MSRQLVTCGADTFVKIFEADNLNSEPRTVEHHDDAVTALAISPKGTHFATGCKDHMVSYFTFPGAEFQKNLTRAACPIRHVAFDPKGRNLAVGGDDAVIRMVNVGISQYTSIRGHGDAVLCVAFDPQGEYLASSSADGTVRIWDISGEGPECVKTLSVTGKVPQGDESHPRAAQCLRVAWHPTGSSLAVPYPEGVHVLERGTWERQTLLQGSHTKEVTMTSWSANGRYLCSAGLDKQIFLWDLGSAESLDRYKCDAAVCDLAWSPTANTISFMDESGQLGMWHQPVPAHLPAPFGDAEAAAAAPVAPATPSLGLGGPASEAVAPGSADAGRGAAAADDDDDDDDAIVADGGDAEGGGDSGGGGGARRRLRKVVHDSDDGGFSDHDDDEAAEAALLAAQLARKGPRALADAGMGMGGLASGATPAARAAAGMAQLLASAGGAPLQEVVQPSSTPPTNGRRFLLWNLTGMVLSRDEQTYSAIEVDFNNTEQHRTMRLTDHYNFTMAALDSAAVMFASKANNGNPSTVVYRPLNSWAPNSEWQVQLDKGEDTLAVALGHKFAAVATSARYLRIYSHTGAQRALLCYHAPLVALVASGGLLGLVQHAGRAAGGADQCLQLCIYDMRDAARPVRLATLPMPLSEGASLAWIGFSEAGQLSTVDSTGVVRQCMRANGYEWVPVLHCAAVKKSKQEHHWVVGITDTQLMCVICKAKEGDDEGKSLYPATLPRPVLSSLPLAMPLACSEPSEPKLEGERLMSQMLLDEYRAVEEENADDDDVQARLLKGFMKLDGIILKLLAHACKAERNARALDLATQLQLPKSLAGAMKLANHYKLPALAERVTMLMEKKFDEGEDVDAEAPPPKPPPKAPAPKPAAVPLPPAAEKAAAAAAAAPADGDADDEEDEPMEEAGDAAENAPPQQVARPPINPFAKTSTAEPAKSALDITATGPAANKRKAVAPVAAKKSKKVA